MDVSFHCLKMFEKLLYWFAATSSTCSSKGFSTSAKEGVIPDLTK